jgi:hypothetical protein
MIMPMKDGKLNAKHFIGGTRDRMSELQNDFHEKVGRPSGLDRGNPRAETRTRHTPHTLAGRASQLDERETSLTDRSSKLDEREKKINDFAGQFQSLYGLLPAEIRELKNKLSRWDNQTPDSLRQFAKMLEVKGCRTVGEYGRIQEALREKEQTRGFSR